MTLKWLFQDCLIVTSCGLRGQGAAYRVVGELRRRMRQDVRLRGQGAAYRVVGELRRRMRQDVEMNGKETTTLYKFLKSKKGDYYSLFYLDV
ncbi:uncharacterized protein A4U43_C07F10560 [Asparagus officinalis]|uniref:Uncharacterized protein n=1 Tax=Asparagus officinalis TaxID=4686 RepID=A0A5P1EE72_ASPOF|nr:uncharacterized protein A4U43_C07F10560 [Asparagus officinalis]